MIVYDVIFYYLVYPAHSRRERKTIVWIAVDEGALRAIRQVWIVASLKKFVPAGGTKKRAVSGETARGYGME